MHTLPIILASGANANLQQRLHQSISSGLSRRTADSPPSLFFRADDIGVPSRQFNEMINLFLRYRTPLCLAVVPTWLTRPRLQSLQAITGKTRLFCWHQHGWRHKNHEQTGKKQEFGPNRPENDLFHDIKNGRKRLHTLLGDSFSPFFTPPWNRCGMSTLRILEKLRFKGISRSSRATPETLATLPDLQVTVDLHTRKAKDSKESLDGILRELEASLATGTTGIMLHHQRMDKDAYHLLELLLQTLSEHSRIRPVTFDSST